MDASGYSILHSVMETSHGRLFLVVPPLYDLTYPWRSQPDKIQAKLITVSPFSAAPIYAAGMMTLFLSPG